MIKLFLDLAYEPQVAIIKDDKIIINKKSKEQHNSDNFMVIVDSSLKDANVDINEIDNICLNIGPGSFTGLRVAAAVAKGLGFNSKIAYQTFTSFDYLSGNQNIIAPGFSNMVYLQTADGKQECVEIVSLIEGISYVTFDRDIYEKLTGLNYKISLENKLPYNKIKLSEDKKINEISLLYLRKSQAEIARENKLKNAK